MRKKIYMFMIALAFSGLFLIGCNKKEIQPEPIPTNEIVEVIETESVGK